MPKKGDRKVFRFLSPLDPVGLVVLRDWFLDGLRVKGFSERTLRMRHSDLSGFILWANDRGITKAREVTKPVLERYQRWLFAYRQETGEPLTFASQYQRLTSLKRFFSALAKGSHILGNPASELELPKLPARLPKDVLTSDEAERILGAPDLATPIGKRDRAILETFYGTGIRRTELAGLSIYDLDAQGGTLRVRHGKGGRERVVPIGERAILFVMHYVEEVRPLLEADPRERALFLSVQGKAMAPDVLTQLVTRYMEEAGLGGKGSCHLFRHTMATLMLEGGADVRFIQEILGHQKLDSTKVYTHVSIKKLKEIHRATHPAARLPERLRAIGEAEPASKEGDAREAADQADAQGLDTGSSPLPLNPRDPAL